MKEQKVVPEFVSDEQRLWHRHADHVVFGSVPTIVGEKWDTGHVRKMGEPVNTLNMRSKDKAALEKTDLPPVPPYAVPWKNRKQAREEAVAKGQVYVDHFEDSKENIELIHERLE